MLIAENITKRYQGKATIEDVSITIRDGEQVSLIGPSGVGKTTLFHVLSGVMKPDEGSVTLNGDHITGTPGRVSYMLQKDLLLQHKTILDNVILPLLVRGVGKKEAKEQALPLFETFGIAGYEKFYPSQLSGGMRQRAALLRTYLFSGSVLLLDEPFSALDAITKADLHKWYLSVAEKMGFSTFFITHDVDEAIRLSDRVYVLNGIPGKIVGEVQIKGEKPRDTEFLTSEAFSAYKRTLLELLSKA
ncbi:MAG: ABC transporter ATP-binding protein [Ruminococcaceae bacterium]|nr:ABC transporter ATP-binding protein [Oscillospiraceae bacterium]